MRIVCRKNGNTLTAVDKQGIAALATLRDGRDIVVSFKRSRNPRHHRLLFALLNVCVEQLEAFPTVEHALTALKIATGHVDTYVDKETGEAYFVPKSIAFESMDQTAFSEFFNDACDVIAERWAPAGMTPIEIRREILEMCDGPQAVGRRA